MKSFTIKFTVISCTVLYLVIRLGDILSLATKGTGDLIFRYLPVGVTAIIATYCIIMGSAKKCLKSDEEDIKRGAMIGPIIVAVILCAWGIYSVHSNVEAIKETSYYSIMSEYTVVDSIIEEAKIAAIKTWVLTTVIYFATAELVAIFAKTKIREKLIDYEEIASNGSVGVVNNTENVISEEEKQDIMQ